VGILSRILEHFTFASCAKQILVLVPDNEPLLPGNTPQPKPSGAMMHLAFFDRRSFREQDMDD
jgi:hypothetical protein